MSAWNEVNIFELVYEVTHYIVHGILAIDRNMSSLPSRLS